MRSWSAERLAEAGGARLLRGTAAGEGAGHGPERVEIDSRESGPGSLFVGLPGGRLDGGAYAGEALRAGAWGVLVAPEHAAAALEAAPRGAVLAHPDPLAGLQALARARLSELRAAGARVVAITGSTGKTSTKDILAELLRPQLRTAASPANFNTEIGLPLAVLGAPDGVEVLILEMAMRAAGQIAELAAIAGPEVGVIVNIGPAHLELLGSLEAIAAAKAELVAGLAPGAALVVPAGEALLAPHLREDLDTITFGEEGEVSLRRRLGDGSVLIAHGEREIALRPSFGQAHNLRNLLAAVAAARALGCTPEGALEVSFSAMRGQRRSIPGGVLLIDDCYNANPMSMRAAIDDLAETAAGRRVAVLGDMLELGPQARSLHREIGAHAQERGVEVLLTVGPLAAEMAGSFAGETHAVPDATAAGELLGRLLREGDTVLVKGSRGVGLEHVTAALDRANGEPSAAAEESAALAPGAGSGQR